MGAGLNFYRRRLEGREWRTEHGEVKNFKLRHYRLMVQDQTSMDRPTCQVKSLIGIVY